VPWPPAWLPQAVSDQPRLVLESLFSVVPPTAVTYREAAG
jgi:hypothetical protein